MSMQILLVEDDLDLASTLVEYCELNGIICDHAANGVAGLELATHHPYRVLVLDINMPRMNGLELCQALRNQGIDTPVLMLTARDTIDDKVAGFNAGTDDYLVKPFELKELLVRIHALAKRRSGQVQKLTVGSLQMDMQKKTVWRDENQIRLSPTGWILLETLMRAAPAVVSRQELEQAVWGDDPPDSNSLKVHLHKLRQAVDKDFTTSLIETVAGQGFALRTDDEN